jgi:hypothetical protein
MMLADKEDQMIIEMVLVLHLKGLLN